jgi:branched-chain amino acid transport system permease protein
MRAVRDNEITLSSAGKRVDKVRREVMMFGSGMMALSGVLISFYYSFVQYQMYDRVSYTFWPWLMITIGGLGNNAGGFMGTMICVTILKGISLFKQTVAFSLIGSAWLRLISEIMDVFLSLFLLYFMIFKPRGLVPEKNITIPGIKYLDLVYDKD